MRPARSSNATARLLQAGLGAIMLLGVLQAGLGQSLTTNRLISSNEIAGMRTSATWRFYWQGQLEAADEAARREVEENPTKGGLAELMRGHIQRRLGNLDLALEHFQLGLKNLRGKGRWSETNSGGAKNFTRFELVALENIRSVYETAGKMGLATKTRFEILKIMEEQAEELAAPEKLNCVDCALVFRNFEMKYRATPWAHSAACTNACEIYRKISAYAETNQSHLNQNPQLMREALSKWASHLSLFELLPEAIRLREKLEVLPFDRRYIAQVEWCTLNLAQDLATRDGVTSSVWAMVDGVLSRLSLSPNREALLSGNLVKGRLLVEAGRSDESAKLLEGLIEVARTNNYQPHLAAALQDRARIRLAAEDLMGAEADVKESLGIYRALGRKENEPALYEIYAQLLGRRRQYENAARTWREAFALCESLQLRFRALHMLLGLAELQKQCGRFAALDSTWRKIESYAASHQSALANPTLLRLHLARLDYLKHKGNAAALATADLETRKFVAGSGLSAHQLSSFDTWVKEYPALISSLQPPVPMEPSVVTRPELDLQPVLQKTCVRADEIARGHFVLSNPSSEPASATLIVTCEPFRCEWSTNQGSLQLALFANRTNGVNSPEIQLELPPGQQVLLTAQCGPLLQITNHNLAIALLGRKGQVARWDFSFGEDAQLLAVVNASLAEDNPFYSLSLFHEVYFRGEQERRVNLRVQSSEPCRIEIYDALSRELLAVDASGDGDFEDAGDSITTDLDLNAYPDFVTNTAAAVSRFELALYPQMKQNRSPRQIEITLSTGAPGEWTPRAIDRVNIR